MLLLLSSSLFAAVGGCRRHFVIVVVVLAAAHVPRSPPRSAPDGGRGRRLKENPKRPVLLLLLPSRDRPEPFPLVARFVLLAGALTSRLASTCFAPRRPASPRAAPPRLAPPLARPMRAGRARAEREPRRHSVGGSLVGHCCIRGFCGGRLEEAFPRAREPAVDDRQDDNHIYTHTF